MSPADRKKKEIERPLDQSPILKRDGAREFAVPEIGISDTLLVDK